MAVIYANGNAGYTSNNATGTSLSIAVTTGGSTDCYIAILVGQSSSSSFSGVTQTNVTWQFCGSWPYAAEGWVFECWVGWATGTPGATLTATNSQATYLAGQVSRWTGIPILPQPLRATFVGSGNLPASFPANSYQTINPSCAYTAGDAVFGWNWWGGSYTHTSSELVPSGGGTVYSQDNAFWPGQTYMGWVATCPTTTETATAYSMGGYSSAITTQIPWAGVLFVIKGTNSGGNMWTQNLSDKFSPADVISKAPALVLSDSDRSTFADSSVQNRMWPPQTFLDTYTPQDLGLIKAPGKSLKDACTPSDSAVATATLNSRSFSDAFSLTDRISEVFSYATLTFLDAVTMVDSVGYTHATQQPPTITFVGVNSGATTTSSSTVTVSMTGMTPNSVFVISIFWGNKTGASGAVSSVTLAGATNFSQCYSTSENSIGNTSMYAMQAVWIGYATSSIASTGTLTVTMNTAIATGIGCYVYQFTGISATGALENAYVGSAQGASGGTSSVSVSSVATTNAGDLEFMAVAGIYDVASSNTLEPCPPTSAPSGFSGFAAQDTAGCGGGCAYRINATATGSHVDTMGCQVGSYNAFAGLVCVFTAGANPNQNFSQGFSERFTSFADSLSYALNRALATETGIQAAIADTLTKGHGYTHPLGLDTGIQAVITDSVSKLDAHSVSDPFTLAEAFVKNHAPGGPLVFSEAVDLLEPGFSKATNRALPDWLTPADTIVTDHGYLPPALADAFTLGDSSIVNPGRSLFDALTLLDIFAPYHSYILPMLSEVVSVSDSVSTEHGIFPAAFDETIGLADVLTAVRTATITPSDFFVLLDAFTSCYTSGGGPLLVYATGVLLGSSTASAFLATWIYAAATGHGFAAGLSSISYLVAALLRGASLLSGLAGFGMRDSGAAAGSSTATGIGGAQLTVVSGSTEGDGSAASDTCLWTAPTGEADGVSPEMDCDTECIFQAEGITTPDTPGSAVGIATYALLHLVAALTGSSWAFARVYSPRMASGSCGGAGSAQYVSIAICDAELVCGASEAVGIGGGLFHAQGECDPLMASYATGTANYRPGRIAGPAKGMGFATGVLTALAR